MFHPTLRAGAVVLRRGRRWVVLGLNQGNAVMAPLVPLRSNAPRLRGDVDLSPFALGIAADACLTVRCSKARTAPVAGRTPPVAIVGVAELAQLLQPVATNGALSGLLSGPLPNLSFIVAEAFQVQANTATDLFRWDNGNSNDNYLGIGLTSAGLPTLFTDVPSGGCTGSTAVAAGVHVFALEDSQCTVSMLVDNLPACTWTATNTESVTRFDVGSDGNGNPAMPVAMGGLVARTYTGAIPGSAVTAADDVAGATVGRSF